MARNHKFFFDTDRTPRARGPAAEKILMTFLETDVQGSDHVCHDLMDDLVAIEDGSDDQREFVGNAHRVTIDAEGVTIEPLHDGAGNGTADGAPGGTADEPTIGSDGAEPVAPGDAPATAMDTATDTATDATAGETVAAGSGDGATPAPRTPARDGPGVYRTGRKHFREVLEDWEAFILDDDPVDDSLLDDDYA